MKHSLLTREAALALVDRIFDEGGLSLHADEVIALREFLESVSLSETEAPRAVFGKHCTVCGARVTGIHICGGTTSFCPDCGGLRHPGACEPPAAPQEPPRAEPSPEGRFTVGINADGQHYVRAAGGDIVAWCDRLPDAELVRDALEASAAVAHGEVPAPPAPGEPQDGLTRDDYLQVARNAGILSPSGEPPVAWAIRHEVGNGIVYLALDKPLDLPEYLVTCPLVHPASPPSQEGSAASQENPTDGK